MRKIMEKIKLILVGEEAYCSYCESFVKVRVNIKRVENGEIEVKLCSKCGREIERKIIREI
ncbi:MAG: hypothetical protein QXX09_03095 [Candidatus Methanomethylicia archaeon]